MQDSPEAAAAGALILDGHKMIEFAAFASSFLTIFVLSSAARNRREGRRNPQHLEYVGYFLCGLLFGTAAILLLMAVVGQPLKL